MNMHICTAPPCQGVVRWRPRGYYLRGLGRGKGGDFKNQNCSIYIYAYID